MVGGSRKPLISVIIATYNEEEYIEECLESLFSQDIDQPFEIIVSDGQSTDATKDLVRGLQRRHKNLVLLENKGRYQAAGRNLALKHAKGSFITYLDGHSYARKDWLRTLHETYKKLEKKDKSLGGVGSIHQDAGKTPLSKATTAAFSSILGGAAGSTYGGEKELRCAHSAFACLYKRSVLEEIGGYDESFIKGEDLEMHARLNERYHLYVQPKAVTYYHKRKSIKGLAKQIHGYGYWRWRVMRKHHSYQPAVFLPSLLVIGFISLLIASAATGRWALIGIPTAAYATAIIIGSLAQGIITKANPLLLLAIYPCIHFSYGVGMLSAMLSNEKKRRKP